jgi:hypothetical protein
MDYEVGMQVRPGSSCELRALMVPVVVGETIEIICGPPPIDHPDPNTWVYDDWILQRLPF